MSFVRAVFAFALLTPVVGAIGSRYIFTAMLAQNPQSAMAPEAADSSTRATRTPTVAATAAPTVRPTHVPSRPRPAPSATKAVLTPTIVLIMGTPTLALQTPAPTARAAPPRVRTRRARPTRRTAHPRVHAAPTPRPTTTPRPTAVPTPRPTPVPTAGIVVLSRYWVSSAVARAGTTIGVGYVIENGTGSTQHVLLGASIKPGRVLSWLSSISDPSHDVVATVPPGVSTHIRYFTLSSRLRPGAYDVAWGLRDAATGRRDAIVAAPSALEVRR